jgi:putative CocE/NonD family hydrolase
MSLASRLFGRLWKLPAPITRDIAAEPLRIPMRDGVELLADRYYPRHSPSQAAPTPTVLIRSCYGRSAFKFIANVFAERGMQVVMQSCRGTSGSQGIFRPFFDEQNDGEDTVEWIERQPWFSGKLALWGVSYLGNTAWAIASSRVAPKIGALGLHVTLTNFRDQVYAFDGFTLMSGVGWTLTMVDIVRAGAGGMNIFGVLIRRRKTKALSERAFATIPLRKADRLLRPEGVFWWQDWMDHAEPGDPWWDATDYGAAARSVPPTAMVGGWYDIFLPFQLRDFAAAQHAGRDVRITIGPWTHAAFPGFAESIRQSIRLFQERFGIGPLEPAEATGRPRVRLFLMGANEWREYSSWPPPEAAPQTFYLHPSGGMSVDAPASESESAFDYDPARPTPACHGPALEARKGSGDMAELERRSDVLVFTAEPVASDVDAIGPVSAEIFFRSNTQHTDLYLCLCDVTPDGRSSNVCDGYRRLRPDGSSGQSGADGRDARKVNIEFWPTAYRFRRGHRMRIIVASGAHPRYSRNSGSGESLGDATSMVVAHQQILHGPGYPSAITLAVVSR